MTIAYDGHPDHAHYLILQAGLPGYGPREVARIAEIVRHHRKGSPATSSSRAARCCCGSPSSSTAVRTRR